MASQRGALVGGTSRGLVLDLIRAQGPISRVSLAEATGLTQATMSTVVRQLLSDGLVVETGHGESTGGKRPVMLDVNPSSRFAVGVQIGRESITYVVADLVGAIVGRTRTPGMDGDEPGGMIERLAQEIRNTLDGLGVDKASVVGVGIAAPGPLDLARGAILHSPHLSAWADAPIRSMLSTAVGLPVVLDNDATAAAIGDFWGGKLDGAVAHASVYMGSGIGAGVLIDGIVFRGASSNAAELGQIVVTDANGAETVLEEVAGPSAIARSAREGGEAERLGLSGNDDFDDFRLIAKASVRGDRGAGALIDRSAAHLASGVLTMANLFDLDSVSLAGPAFAVAGPAYVRAISARLESDFFGRAQHQVAVRLSADVSDAAAVGGAALVLQSELAPRTMGLSAPATV
ncbi:ROK family transcriptional regulator [Humibacter ginsenosidimutans]|uniref:ROK family transcriptional regulator n=1 Tax=Humibacter ginsenosidimutans TaxID=2599293 RepID=A0A5B8M5K1_9MICO|nr:ROK family transcriptional regulator [Humibacter ginsenosidimutans]QDZ15125.1 ROK family transcriptional regulator [Humibacter ginsenosidimutans]